MHLNTNQNLSLSQGELNKLEQDPYNYSEEQIAEVATFCADLPSQVLEVDNGNGQQDPKHPIVDEQETGSYTVLKRFCEADNSDNANSNCNGRVAPDVDVTFNVYDSEDTLLGTIVVTDFNEGNGSQGTAQSTMDLVVGETYTVCEVAPEGWEAVPRPGAQGGANQTGGGDCIIVELGPGNNVLQFDNFPVPVEPGAVIVKKYYCEGTEFEGPAVVNGEFDTEGCDVGDDTSIFDILDDEGTSLGLDLSTLFTTGVELLPGDYTLVEYDGDAVVLSVDFTIEANQTAPVVIQVVNPVTPPEEGMATVMKYFCTDTDITVPVVGDEGDYDGCEPATAEQLAGVNFLVYPFGVAEDAIDVDDTALLTTGVTLPAGTHTLVEVFNGTTHVLADLPIVDGQTTSFVVFNPIAPEEITINLYKFVCSEILGCAGRRLCRKRQAGRHHDRLHRDLHDR